MLKYKYYEHTQIPQLKQNLLENKVIIGQYYKFRRCANNPSLKLNKFKL